MDFKFKKSNLNFNVYAVPDIPSSGTENDIAIITNTPMTNWVLSTNEPSGVARTDGDVWIMYSASGDVFDAFNSNNMMIATVFAWQYINNEWVGVKAVSYHAGKWTEWITYVVENGAEVIPFAGKLRSTSNMTLTAADGYLEVHITNSATSGPATSDKVNIDNIKKIFIDIDVKEPGDYVALCISKALNATTQAAVLDNVVKKKITTARGRHIIGCNVESCTGEYYIGAFSCISAESASAKFNIHNIYYI